MSEFMVSNDEMLAVLVADGKTSRLKAVPSQTRFCTTCAARNLNSGCRVSSTRARPCCCAGRRKDRCGIVWEEAPQ